MVAKLSMAAASGEELRLEKTIVVAGATGNLGSRIVGALVRRGAKVVAIVRPGSDNAKVSKLESLGAKTAAVDFSNVGGLTAAMASASCVVSALAGLHDVVVDAQIAVLEAAVAANVPRFIPSDFSIDFTKLTPGENRNFDLRREFHKRLDTAPIAHTAIFNGSFADILSYNVPLFDSENRTVGFWDDPSWYIDFTTMDDTAAFTAAAAVDDTTPRAFHIASFQVSASDLVAFSADVLKTPYCLVDLGSRADLADHTKRERAAHPQGETELYPSWQQSQYLLSMFSAHHDSLDNGRYPDLTWTSLNEFLQPHSNAGASDEHS